MTKNSSFSRFMAVFMSYCPYFSGSRAICMARKTRYMFERYAKNSSFSCFMVVFMSYCPLFRVCRAICMARKTRYMFESYDQKLIVFAFYGRFHELLPTVFGFSGRFAWLERPDTCLRVRTKNP